MLQMKITPDLHPQERRKMIRQLKKIWAVHHMIYISESEVEIAAAVNVGVARLQKWKQTKEWQHAIAFWKTEPLVPSKGPLDVKPGKTARRTSLKSLKAKWCVHFMLSRSDLIDDICYAVNISESALLDLYHSRHWEEALDDLGVEDLWSRVRPPVKDKTERTQLRKSKRSLACAERCWTEMIENGYDLFPSDIENLFREHPYLNSEDEEPKNPIGLEALQPPPSRFIWIHDITMALFMIGSII